MRCAVTTRSYSRRAKATRFSASLIESVGILPQKCFNNCDEMNDYVESDLVKAETRVLKLYIR